MISVWFGFPGCREDPVILCPWPLNRSFQASFVHGTQASVLPWDFGDIPKKYIHLSLLPSLSRKPLKIREEMLTRNAETGELCAYLMLATPHPLESQDYMVLDKENSAQQV